MAKKEKKGQKNRSRKNILIFFLIILVLFGVYKVAGYHQQSHLEKKFLNLNQDFNSLQTKLKQVTPDKTWDKKKYCYRESGKFQEGPMRCAIEISSTNLSQQEINKVKKTILKKGWEGIIDNSAVQDYAYKDDSFFCRSFTIKQNGSNSLKFFCNQKSNSPFYPYREN